MNHARDLVLVGVLAAAAYFFTRKNSDVIGDNKISSWETPIAAGTVTPAGNIVKSEISSVREGIAYINEEVLSSKNSQIVVTNGILPDSTKRTETGTVYIQPNKRSTQGSGRILEPAAGGGYKQVGATNIKLSETPKATKTVTLSSGKTYRLNN